MSLTRDMAIKLGSQLRGGKTTAITRLSRTQLDASSLKRPKFAAAIATKINERLANYTVKSLTVLKRDDIDLVFICEIHPAGATN